MRKISTIALFFVIFNFSYATIIDTPTVSGIWDIASSPYEIYCDIEIPDGETLSIEPGIEVIFMGQYYLNVQGCLNANGSEDENLVFKANDESIGWLGINFVDTPISNPPSVINYCTIQDGNAKSWDGINLYTWIGGGVYVENFSKLDISNSFFTNNVAGAGSAIGCNGSSPTIIDNTFRGNRAGYDDTSGYATIECRYGSSPKIWNNLIEQNWIIAGEYGAGSAIRLLDQSNASIKNNIIRENYIDSRDNQTEGIVMYIHTSDPFIMNNLIYDNYVYPEFASGEGGALWFYQSTGKIINNTIKTNKASDGAALFFKESSPDFHNNIIRGNESGYSGDNIHLHDSACDPNFYHNNIEGGLSSFGGYGVDSLTGAWINNIDEDPQYEDQGNGIIFDLATDSPCIDTGSLEYLTDITMEELDLLGNVRIFGANIDMGAVEANDTGISNVITPSTCILEQNYPNPFNPSTMINFSLLNDQNVKLRVLNINGQEINLLLDSKLSAGNHQIKFDASRLTSGIYFYQIETNDFITQKKMILCR